MDELIKEIAALESRLSEIAAKMKAIDAAATKTGNQLSEEQETEWESLDHEADSTQAAIARKRKALGVHNAASISTGRMTAPNAPNTPQITGVRDRVEDDPRRGFRSLEDFAQSVRRACTPGASAEMDPRLKISAAPSSPHTTYVGEDGGYLAPPEFRTGIWDAAVDESTLLAMADVQPTSSNRVIQTKNEDMPWSTSGIVAKWADEATQYTETRARFKQEEVNLHKCYVFTTASDEELEDAPLLESRLLIGAARAIAWKVDEAIVNGDGQGEPLGFFRAGSGGALVSVAKVASQTADTINATNVATMYSRLLRTGNGAPFWMINPDAAPQLYVMTIGDRVIWTPPSEGFKDAPGGFLLGLPILFSQHCETLGDKGDINLVDLRAGYAAYNKQGGIKFDSSIHLYFDYGTMAFRWTVRIGGKPHLSAAVSANNGSATFSHFVTLDARA